MLEEYVRAQYLFGTAPKIIALHAGVKVTTVHNIAKQQVKLKRTAPMRMRGFVRVKHHQAVTFIRPSDLALLLNELQRVTLPEGAASAFKQLLEILVEGKELDRYRDVRKRLREKKQEMIRMLAEGKNQSEIAKHFGVTRQRISQILLDA